MKSLSRVRLFGTPWTVAFQAPWSLEFSRREYWNGLPFAPPGDLPEPGTEPASLMSPALAGRFFTTVPPGKPAPNPFPCLGIESRPLAQDGTSPGAHPAPDLPLGQLRLT